MTVIIDCVSISIIGLLLLSWLVTASFNDQARSTAISRSLLGEGEGSLSCLRAYYPLDIRDSNVPWS